MMCRYKTGVHCGTMTRGYPCYVDQGYDYDRVEVLCGTLAAEKAFNKEAYEAGLLTEDALRAELKFQAYSPTDIDTIINELKTAQAKKESEEAEAE